VEFLIEVIEHPGLEVHSQSLDLSASKVEGDEQGGDDRHGLNQAQQIREPEVGPEGLKGRSFLQ